MAIAYRCDDSTGLCVSVWDGEVTDDERRRHIAALAADPEWGAQGLLLTDLTGIAASARPTAKQVLEAAADFAEKLAGQVRDAKWAMVAGETFVLAQRFGSYLEEEVRRLIVFNDLDTACTWLGVDTATARVIIDDLRAGMGECRDVHPDTAAMKLAPLRPAQSWRSRSTVTSTSCGGATAARSGARRERARTSTTISPKVRRGRRAGVRGARLGVRRSRLRVQAQRVRARRPQGKRPRPSARRGGRRHRSRRRAGLNDPPFATVRRSWSPRIRRSAISCRDLRLTFERGGDNTSRGVDAGRAPTLHRRRRSARGARSPRSSTSSAVGSRQPWPIPVGSRPRISHCTWPRRRPRHGRGTRRAWRTRGEPPW